jgi:hypothetical protein
MGDAGINIHYIPPPRDTCMENTKLGEWVLCGLQGLIDHDSDDTALLDRNEAVLDDRDVSVHHLKTHAIRTALMAALASGTWGMRIPRSKL